MEELQLLRSMMKEVHSRNARFYKQVDSINVHEETSQQKPMEKDSVAFTEGDLRAEENEPNPKSRNHHNSRPSSYQAGISQRPIKVNSQGIPAENHGALTVSAEVLKLNEQIARVRQQLTSLCSTDQTDPSPSPGSVDKSRPQKRSMHFDIPPSPHQPIQLDSYEEIKAKKGSPQDQKISAFRRTSSTRYHETFEQEKASAKSSKGQENQQPWHKPSLNWADMGSALPGKTALKQEQSGLTREVCSSSDYPLRMRKEKVATRPSARDSLGTSRLRTNCSKRLKVRVPSVASSHSDIVCTHCQRHITDEENAIALHDSTPEMSNNPSPKSQNKQSHFTHEPTKHWRDFRSRGLDSSTGSEEREAAHRSSHKFQRKFNPHGLPELASRSSDESDVSRPSGSALPRQCASVPTARINSHSAPRKPWLKTRDRRGALQHEKDVHRPQVAKDGSQLRKASGPILRKKSSVGVTGKLVRKERAFPANLRENIHSHQPELGQFRLLTNNTSKVP